MSIIEHLFDRLQLLLIVIKCLSLILILLDLCDLSATILKLESMMHSFTELILIYVSPLCVIDSAHDHDLIG